MNNWDEVSIEECTSVLGDGLHGTPIYSDDGDYFFVNGNNLSNGKIVIKPDTKRITFEEYEKYKKPLNDRTILVSINGTLGNVGVYENQRIILGKSACYFNIKEEYDKDFIYYVVNSPEFRAYLELYATGTTIKNASLRQMREYKFKCPSLSVQKKVSTVLKQIDEKIAINDAINKNLSLLVA